MYGAQNQFICPFYNLWWLPEVCVSQNLLTFFFSTFSHQLEKKWKQKSIPRSNILINGDDDSKAGKCHCQSLAPKKSIRRRRRKQKMGTANSTLDQFWSPNKFFFCKKRVNFSKSLSKWNEWGNFFSFNTQYVTLFPHHHHYHHLKNRIIQLIDWQNHQNIVFFCLFVAKLTQIN